MLADLPQPRPRDLIFISYAYEDEVFAKWLARKLAYYGYGVWFDQMKILGGESWVEEVEVAITECSIRVVAILSKSSITKANPRKERTKALDVGRSLDISDFLLTLNLDGTKPDWTISDISYISFKESWAQGLRRVLKKLQSINAPQIHASNTGIAASTLETGGELMLNEPETISSNWLPFLNLPQVLKIFDTSRLTQDEERSWPNLVISPGRVAAFSAPQGEIGERVANTPETYHWPSSDTIRKDVAQTVVTRILNRAVDRILKSAGCQFCYETKLYYTPDDFRGEKLVRFVDVDGSPRFFRTSGKRTFRKPAGPPETVIHRPAIRAGARRISEDQYVLQIQPAVALFDSSGRPITGRAVGPRRKKVTLGWYNESWRRRVLAFAQIIAQQSITLGHEEFEISQPVSFPTDRSLSEALLTAVEVNDDEDREITIPMEEMEDWSK